jgi:hypothetical protein
MARDENAQLRNLIVVGPAASPAHQLPLTGCGGRVAPARGPHTEVPACAWRAVSACRERRNGFVAPSPTVGASSRRLHSGHTIKAMVVRSFCFEGECVAAIAAAVFCFWAMRYRSAFKTRWRLSASAGIIPLRRPQNGRPGPFLRLAARLTFFTFERNRRAYDEGGCPSSGR